VVAVSSFTRPLRYENTDKWEDGRRVVRITKAFRYYVGRECSSLWVDVEEGFETDLASIPRIFWGLISPDSPFSSAYVVHDKLYRDAGPSRFMCDLILYEALGVPQRVETDSGEVHVTMPFEQRMAVYRAVRLGGWRAYRRYAAAEAAES
jgi:Protein of unknown function (DUF1353)